MSAGDIFFPVILYVSVVGGARQGVKVLCKLAENHSWPRAFSGGGPR